MRTFSWQMIVVVVGLLLPLGCSQNDYGDLGHVTGTVTLDGQPYANAMLEFSPEAGGRPSKGVTDADGKYELIYIRTTRGAELGQHKIVITTIPTENGAPGVEKSAKLKDPIPSRYNARTELVHKIEAGDNQIDFALESK